MNRLFKMGLEDPYAVFYGQQEKPAGRSIHLKQKEVSGHESINRMAY